MAKKSICVNCVNFQKQAGIGVVGSDGERRDTGYYHCCQVAIDTVKKPDYVLGDYSVVEADLPSVFCKACNVAGECKDYDEIKGKTPVSFAENAG
jgi:hypothetical protein